MGFYLVVLPLIWLIAALVSWRYPGDEFLLFQLVSGLPAAWIPLLFGRIQGSAVVPILLCGGLTTVALVGWLMDGLQVRRLLWTLLFVVGVPAVLFYGLAQYPSYERAIARNGSLTAYVAAATNLSLYMASTLAIVVTIIRRLAEHLAVTSGRLRGASISIGEKPQ